MSFRFDIGQAGKYINIKPNSHKLGVVYQGGKRYIAEQLLKKMYELMPNATKFYDLFGGGGAMTAYARLCGFEVTYNEYNKGVFDMFKYFATGGKVTEEMLKWCDRDEFFEIYNKDDKSIVEVVKQFAFSFGGGARTFFCHKNREELKMYRHNFIVYNDLDSARFLDNWWGVGVFEYMHNKVYHRMLDLNMRRSEFSGICKKLEAIKASGMVDHFKDWGYANYKSISDKDLLNFIKEHKPDIDFTKYEGRDIKGSSIFINESSLNNSNLQGLNQLKDSEGLHQVEPLQHLEQLKKLNLLNTYKGINFINGSYDEVELDKNAIIYCDIPYYNTSGYLQGFNHKKFYEWCHKKKDKGYKIFISEYTMPDEFECILELSRVELYSSGGNTNRVIEKLFTL